MYISICDDESHQTNYMQQLVTQWAGESGVSVNISIFHSAEEFKSAWETDNPCDLLLLDIQMGGQNGVALAKDLRKCDDSLMIIFITAITDYMQQGYDVAALHYLLKPVDEARLFDLLNQAAKRLTKEKQTLALQIDGEIVRVGLEDILCIESFAHSIEVTLKDAQYTVKMPAYKLEEQLGQDFIRCHRSYIVGLRHVSKISKTDVLLDNGKVIPLSRRLYSQVNQAFMKYVRGTLQ